MPHANESTTASTGVAPRVRPAAATVGVVFLTVPDGVNVWPFVDRDYTTRTCAILQELSEGCSGVDFVPLTVGQDGAEADLPRVRELMGAVDGVMMYFLCTNWGLAPRVLDAIVASKLPTLLVDDLYAGSGVFLTQHARLLRAGAPVVGISSSRTQDAVEVARCFRGLAEEPVGAEAFRERAAEAYAATFRPGGVLSCRDDPVEVRSVGTVLERLRDTRLLAVTRDQRPVREVLGATVLSADFDEINAAYEDADPDEAARLVERWSQDAAEVVEPWTEDLQGSARIYLAMRTLLDRHGAQGITMDCLGGFYSGMLPGYPCLGYRQMNDDGVLSGTCEAQVRDLISMVVCREMFGRACFASDPVLDTARNQIIYAHCVAPTRMFGPDGPANAWRIRSHAEDHQGASVQSLMPAGYLTTTFDFSHDFRSLIVHQAKAVGNVDNELACRTKLAAEVKGDIGKLFAEWDRYSWHRVTVYGDVREPLEELAKATGLEFVHEA
ncbi:MAG: hypothetical protein IPM29_27135 [Planctomycetes bacterium]|nr:hypothetical protein [Planctomycetota bacterium]